LSGTARHSGGPPFVRDARGDEVELVATLFREYAAALEVDLAFQDFDRELASLPGDYVNGSGGALLLAWHGDSCTGCVALRAIDGERCEMKRLYVRPAARGLGIGRLLAEAAIERAQQLGYRWMLLDTLPAMREAQELYRRLGFVETAPYRFNPVPGAAFFELTL
jgi:ribosomal protein S18 acetylase RimI-like enzyme